MKNSNLLNNLMMATIVAIVSMLTGCAKDTSQDGNINLADKSLSTYEIPLTRSEIDTLAKEIGIAHNCVLFALYQDPTIDTLDATSLCSYVHDFIVENGDLMELKVLPLYMSAAQNYNNLITELYSDLGASIENNDSVFEFPNNVNHNLIMESMNEYYEFIAETFQTSSSYDVFEAVCMERLNELCDSTSTMEEYFFMRAGGNITFASYCAWVSIFSGYTYNAKGALRDGIEYLRREFNKVKDFVEQAVIPIAEIVRADLKGGLWGGGVGFVGFSSAMVLGASGLVGVGIFAGCWVVGAAVGSLSF